ncbi:MAG: tetratricopeptide repeat protein [Acidobacteriota bacterium]|nr:tetratricopeptide repeat protein [Acidobacteriota bacterium]
MSFDKTKYMRNAERFLAQGKIRQAIGEYKRIVENDPKDFSILNMLGDLCVKAQDTQEAVRCYAQVAEHYARQGFAQKAIAVYNKISRIKPDSIEVSAKLAELYHAKGSVAEARTHYTALADHFQKRGSKAEALAVWKQIADLDPNNTEIYLKIAESCLQDEQRDEAANAFTEAGNRFALKKQYEQAIAIFSKALEIKPSNLIALNGLVNAQIGSGFADDAAKTLEEMLEKQPYNREILNLLVNCYLDINNSEEAEKTVVKLVEQEAANYPKFLDVTKNYLKNNDLQSAARVLSITSEHLLLGGQAEELGFWVNEILAKNPEHLDALRLLVRYHGWQRDEAELKQSLERLAESARLNESVEDERYALSQLIMMFPQEASYPQRLQEINEQYGYAPSAGEEFEPVIASAEAFEVPTFESFAIADGAQHDESALGAAGAAMYLEDYTEFKPDEHFQYETIYQNGSASNGFIYEYNGESATMPVLVTDFDLPENGFAVATATDADADADADVDDLDSYYGNVAQISDVTIIQAEEQPETKIVDEARLREELETVEYYSAQGYKDLALKTLDSMVETFGSVPEIEQARRQIENEAPQQQLEPQEQEEPEQPQQFEPETATVSTSTSANNFDILSDFRSELGLEEQDAAEPEGDYETHYQTGVAYQEMGLMEDAIREFQDAIKIVSANDGTRRFFHCCNLLGHCFMEKGMPNIALMWYRRGIETIGLSPEELLGLRYEIANAYEVGGEPDKAVEYFEQIYAIDVEYRDVSRRLSQLHAAR